MAGTAALTMNVVDYANRVNIGVRRMYQLTRIDGFPVLRIGKRNRLILVEEADKWLKTMSGQQL